MRILAALIFVLSACTAQPEILYDAVVDPAWSVPSPEEPRSRDLIQPPVVRDPSRSPGRLGAATLRRRARPRFALGVTEAEPRGLLEIIVRFPTGEPYGLGGYITVYPTGPLDLTRPIWELQYQEHHSGPVTQLWLPPGEYQVLANSSDYVPDCGVGWTPTLVPYGGTQATLTIRADETTSFDAVLKAGGRLRLAIDDGREIPVDYSVRLVPQVGPSLPIEFYRYEEYPYSSDEYCPSGSSRISCNIIAEGSYTLECEGPEGDISRAEVRIGNGMVTTVVLSTARRRHETKQGL